jgi:mono/diheme cytochrome c family protein
MPSRDCTSVWSKRNPAPAIAVALSLIAPAAAQNAPYSSSESTLSDGFAFAEQTGEKLYVNVCQGCHMPDGKGAVGAAAYPSLANNRQLAASRYAVDAVVNGQRAMPPLGLMLSDDQVAAVVNYVRTHFGNTYDDTVTAQDVRAARR